MHPLCSHFTFSWADWCAPHMKHLVLGLFEPQIKISCVCVCACMWAQVSRRYSGDTSACRICFYVMELMQVMHILSYGTGKRRLFEGINLPASWQMTLWWGAVQSFQEGVPGSLSDSIPILLQRDLGDSVSGDWMTYHFCSEEDRRIEDQYLLLAVQEHLLPLSK